MVKRIQKTQSRGEFEREERLASRTLAGARDRGPRRYPSRGEARHRGQEAEEARDSPQGKSENAGSAEPPRADPGEGVLVESEEDFPTGVWNRQRINAKVKQAERARRGAARTSRPTPGRTAGGPKGVGRAKAGRRAESQAATEPRSREGAVRGTVRRR